MSSEDVYESLRIAWEKHVLKLVSEGKCHLSGSEVFVDLYGYLCLEKDLFVVPFCFAREKMVKIIWKFVL